ncbi:MAG: cyanophycinase [candidate division KSB1 bacterium]|nr:cyanophycinase [candidate division KSB1 bacterium]
MKRHALTAFACLVVAVASAQAGQRGFLLIVGGGAKPTPAVEEFVRLCGGGPILVITSASASPEEAGPSAARLFAEAGAHQVSWLHIAGPDTANADTTVERIRQARGVFFTGGVQTRLMERLAGTRAEEALRSLYFERGGCIGGTSAGAAVLSEVMITGDGDLGKLERGNIVTARGLGFLTTCIVDQHFVARQRNNRLLSLVMEKHLIGLGIDESTAIVYYPNDTFRVYGDGSVLVYDPRHASVPPAPESKRLTMEGIRLTVLKAGQTFDLRRGRTR